MADSTFKFNEQVLATVAPLDAQGQAATVDVVPVWTTGNAEVVSLEPSTDGLTCTIKGIKGAPDDIPITCTMDADLGAGVRELVARGTVRVLAGEAVTVAMTFGPAEPSEPVPMGSRRR